jgi:L-lactate dehydrogenase
MRVGIIGAGIVGVELVNYLYTLSTMREIVLINRTQEKAWAEIEDFSYVASFTYARHTVLSYGGYEACKGCDIVVITAGAQLQGEQTRDVLLEANAPIIREMIIMPLKS